MRLQQASKAKGKTTNTKNPFVYKERKERVIKPTNTLPPPFYTSDRKGYSWCDTCGGYNRNVLNSLTLTCASGHDTILYRSGVDQTLKLEQQVNVGIKLLMI